ncbi:MAG TPA: HEAT repeat domain-containing protein [Pseudonocardiaceae bacterium]|nr:HEAT repeat domain-containing protein [Pseudonocardiaceae bacterium]
MIAGPSLRGSACQPGRSHAAEHLAELTTEFGRERDDHGLRCWLLELIGEARSPAAVPLLIEQLHGEDEALRTWAVSGLEKLDTKDARRALRQARTSQAPVPPQC